MTEYRKGLAIVQRLTAADPGNTEWQRDLSIAHTRIGDVLATVGQREEALAEYRSGFAIDEKLAAADPKNASWQIDLVLSLWRLAERGGDNPRAQYNRALTILRRLDTERILSSDQQNWIATIEQRLAELPPEQAEAR